MKAEVAFTCLGGKPGAASDPGISPLMDSTPTKPRPPSITTDASDPSSGPLSSSKTPKHCNKKGGETKAMAGANSTIETYPASGPAGTALPHLQQHWHQQTGMAYPPQPYPHGGQLGYPPPPPQSFGPSGPHFGPRGPPPAHHMQSPGSLVGAGSPHTPPHPRGSYCGGLPSVSPGSFGRGLPPTVPNGISGSNSWEQQRQRNSYPSHGYLPMVPYSKAHHLVSQQINQGQQQVHQQFQQQQDAAGQFSRTVSGSFEKSDAGSKDGSGKPATFSHDLNAYNNANGKSGQSKYVGAKDDVSEGAASDHSWGMLHQVQSVDEHQLKAATAVQKEEDSKASNADSARETLVINPSDKAQPSLSTPSKLKSLTSLSSVASAQEPIPEAYDSANFCDSNPVGGGHKRTHSFDQPISIQDINKCQGDRHSTRSNKKARSIAKPEESIKGRTTDKSKDSPSPLSISCTPPASPGLKSNIPVATLTNSSASAQEGDNSSLSASPEIPNYSFSIESMPSFSKDATKDGSFTTGLPPRPGSVSSGSIGPAPGRNGSDTIHHSMPSWDMNGSDSIIGGISIGSQEGRGLFSSFSFTNDYHMLTQNGSQLGYAMGSQLLSDGSASQSNSRDSEKNGQKPKEEKEEHTGKATAKRLSTAIDESRNPSFDQSNQAIQQGGIARTDTFDTSYTMSSILSGPYMQPMTGQFPLHAPSWTSTGSGPTPKFHQSHPGMRGNPMYSPHRTGVPIPRTFTDDSAKSSTGYGPPPISNVFHPGYAMHSGQIGKRPPPQYVMAPGSGAMGNPLPPRPFPNGRGSGPKGQGVGHGVFNWSKDDDARLTDIMKKYKNPRDWEPVARDHGRGKSAKDCHERWIRYLKPGVRKGQWTDAEDAIVVEAVTSSDEQPFTRWSDLAQRLPGRVGKQIRDRWVNHLNPNINHMPFSRADDLLLWNGHKKYGKRWVEISTQCFNSSRSENHIKNRWYSASFKKFISNEFGPDAYAATVHITGKKPKKKDKEKDKEKAKEKDTGTASVTE